MDAAPNSEFADDGELEDGEIDDASDGAYNPPEPPLPASSLQSRPVEPLRRAQATHRGRPRSYHGFGFGGGGGSGTLVRGHLRQGYRHGQQQQQQQPPGVLRPYKFRGLLPRAKWRSGRGAGRSRGGGGGGGVVVVGAGEAVAGENEAQPPLRMSQMSFPRIMPARGPNHGARPEPEHEESFDELLETYRQIQKELEEINQEEMEVEDLKTNAWYPGGGVGPPTVLPQERRPADPWCRDEHHEHRPSWQDGHGGGERAWAEGVRHCRDERWSWDGRPGGGGGDSDDRPPWKERHADGRPWDEVPWNDRHEDKLPPQPPPPWHDQAWQERHADNRRHWSEWHGDERERKTWGRDGVPYEPWDNREWKDSHAAVERGWDVAPHRDDRPRGSSGGGDGGGGGGCTVGPYNQDWLGACPGWLWDGRPRDDGRYDERMQRPPKSAAALLNSCPEQHPQPAVSPKAFRPFELKPLRQKILKPAELDELNKKKLGHSETGDDGGSGTRDGDEGPRITEDGNGAGSSNKLCQATESSHSSCSSKTPDSSPDLILQQLYRGRPTPKLPDGAGKENEEEGEEEDEEELQLRLLALKSASHKWQQKERQVLQSSREKQAQPRTPPAKSRTAPAKSRSSGATTSRVVSASQGAQAKPRATPARRRPSPAPRTTRTTARSVAPPHPSARSSAAAGRTRSWQRRQEAMAAAIRRRRRRDNEEEAERRRQEADEIRRIRELPSTEEQYVRFMKILGDRGGAGGAPAASPGVAGTGGGKAGDAEVRRPRERRVSELRANLFQHDNYEEVAMEVDSESNSPMVSPQPFAVHGEGLSSLGLPVQAFAPHSLLQVSSFTEAAAVTRHVEAALPGPLPPEPCEPPPLPPGEPEQPPKPPFEDEAEEEEMLLREELLKSIQIKRVTKPEKEEADLEAAPEKTSSPLPTPPLPPPPPPPPLLLLSVLATSTPISRNGTDATPRSAATPTPFPSTVSPTAAAATAASSGVIAATTAAAVTTTAAAGGGGISRLQQRIPPAKRPKITLPQHKSVVVSLGGDSDSDTEGEAAAAIGSRLLGTGLLEMMIKEARRTADAAKPKPQSNATEENRDPQKTPEAMPDAQKPEYRRLRDEIMKRERLRLGGMEITQGSPATSDTDTEPGGGAQSAALSSTIADTETQLGRQRQALAKDSLLLSQLVAQKEKKAEGVRLAEIKALRLREQLRATETVLSANFTLMRKIDEQVDRIKQRMDSKAFVVGQLEEELARARALVSKHLGKELPNVSRLEQPLAGVGDGGLPVTKRVKLDPARGGGPGNLRQEFIAREKLRLQGLEQEYAEKIRRLKAAQSGGGPAQPKTGVTVAAAAVTTAASAVVAEVAAVKIAAVVKIAALTEMSAVAATEGQNKALPGSRKRSARCSGLSLSTPPAAPTVSQPSLHDLSQDKLTFGPVEEGDADDAAAQATPARAGAAAPGERPGPPTSPTSATRPRRLSLTGGGLVTRPNLPGADGLSGKAAPTSRPGKDATLSRLCGGPEAPAAATAVGAARTGRGSVAAAPEVEVARQPVTRSSKRRRGAAGARGVGRGRAKGAGAAEKSAGTGKAVAGGDLGLLAQAEAQGLELEAVLAQFSRMLLPAEGPTGSEEDVVLGVDLVRLSCPAVRDSVAEPFGPYKSPLLAFKTYRFSTYFRTKEQLLLSSPSFSNKVEPRWSFCHFELTGTCNDEDCPWQHMADCTLSREELFQDILSYDLPLLGCTSESSPKQIVAAAESYVRGVLGPNTERVTADQVAVLLVSKVNERARRQAPFTTFKERRAWRPVAVRKTNAAGTAGGSDSESGGDDGGDRGALPGPAKPGPAVAPAGQVEVAAAAAACSERYFSVGSDDVARLEEAVERSPGDIQLWIKLSYKYLHQPECDPADALNAALNCLSRALEANRSSGEVWGRYLALFAGCVGSHKELQEMCEVAVGYAPDHGLWWQYLSLERTYEGKDYVCSRLLQFLVATAPAVAPADRCLHSHRLLEALLYRVQLNICTGRLQLALAIFRQALKAAGTAGKEEEEQQKATREPCVSALLLPADRALAWLSYLHAVEFGELPSALADPAYSLPGALVRKEPFVLPWRRRGDLKTPPAALLALLQEAVRACSSDPSDDCGDAQAETLAACLPIHRNALRVHALCESWDEALALCGAICTEAAGGPLELEACAALAETLVQRGDAAEGARAWLGALLRRPRDARLAYHAAKILAAHAVEEKPIAVLESLAASFFAEEEAATTELLFRSLLGCPVPYNFRAPDFAAGVSRETLQAQQGYLWLCYCSWQVLASPEAGATDAHEAALGAQLTAEPLRLLWLDYLTQARARLLASASKAPELRSFTALVHRCLATVPVRRVLPHASAKYWADYTFHNQVVDVYVGCLPPCHRSTALERLHALAPANAALALRLLVAEAEEGNIHSVALQAKLLIQRLPSCLFIWKIFIAATRKLHGPSELRRLFVRALHCLPLSASLWKDFVLAEAAAASSLACGGGKGESPVQRALALCREAGVSLAELLPSSVTLSPGPATS